MKIYLTGRRARREELRGYREQLRRMGHEVMASWLDVTDDAPAELLAQTGDGGGLDPTKGSDMSFNAPNQPGHMKSRKELLLAVRAAKVFTEIALSDALIAFTDLANHTREVAYGEYGFAVGRKVTVWIVGPRYDELHYYSDVLQYDSWPEFLKMLQGVGGEQAQEKGGHA